MPTGYTTHVATGKITSLSAFAMLCSRAFGAAISMRHLPIDAPVPDRFEPHPHHANRAQQARARLAQLKAMSPIDAQRDMQQAHSAAMARWRGYTWEDAAQRVRYDEMLAQVLAWREPTGEHQALKQFMLQQLRDSIKSDCDYSPSMPRLMRWPDWLRKQIADTEDEIEYQERYAAEDRERADGHTQWFQHLRTSLAH